MVYSSPSFDNFTFFVAHIRTHVSKEEQTALAGSWDPVTLLVKSFKKYFRPLEYHTNKDYVLKGVN